MSPNPETALLAGMTEGEILSAAHAHKWTPLRDAAQAHLARSRPPSQDRIASALRRAGVSGNEASSIAHVIRERAYAGEPLAEAARRSLYEYGYSDHLAHEAVGFLPRGNPETAGARAARRGLEQTAREREAAFKAGQRAELASLRAEIKRLGERKARALAQIREQCERARAGLPALSKAIRAQARQAVAETRQGASNRCALRKSRLRFLSAKAVAKARSDLAREKLTQRIIRRAERKAPRVTRAEVRAESDSAVESNLPADLLPVWRKVKRQIRPGPGISRTEAFLGWVEENAGDVWAMRERQAEAELQRLIAEEERASRGRRAPSRGSLEAVPF